MAWAAVIAHHLLRNGPGAPVQWRLRKMPFEANGALDALLREVKLAYIKKSGKTHGGFSQDRVSHPLSTYLTALRQQQLSLEGFAQQVLPHFKQLLEKTECPLEGYLFFAEEQLEGQAYFYIFLLQHSSTLYMDGQLELSQGHVLDTQLMPLAARIDITQWEAQENSHYLSWVRARGEPELSQVFADFIGFCDKIDTKAQTQALLEAVEQFTHSQSPEDAASTKQTVVDYCLEQSKQAKPVALAELAQQFPQDAPVAFSTFVQQQPAPLAASLIPDSATLRQYVRFSGRNDLLSMSFAAECLGSAIEYQAETETLIIRAIPPALKNRLLKHLKKQG